MESKLDALTRAREVQAQKRISGEKTQILDPLQRSALKPRSLRLAVTAKCFDCQGGQADPGIRLRIKDCPISACPLYALRPYQGRKPLPDDGCLTLPDGSCVSTEACMHGPGFEPLDLLDEEACPRVVSDACPWGDSALPWRDV
jgi:hypothetical protein